MKNAFAKISFSVIALSLIQGCGAFPGTSYKAVEPGYTGLKIPQYGKNKGIENSELVSGRVWYNGYTEDVIIFPTFITTYPFTKTATEGSPNDEAVNFAVAGSPVSADVGVSFGYSTDLIGAENITDPRVSETSKETYTQLHKYYKKYRKTPDAFLAINIRNGLRDCFSSSSEKLKLRPTDLPTNQQSLTGEVKSCLSTKFPEVTIEQVSLLSPLRLDPKIQERINDQFASQQAAQAAEFNKKRAEAEAETKVAEAKGVANAKIESARGDSIIKIEQAKAEAESNALLTNSITPELIELKKLEIQLREIEKWNGQKALTTIQTPNVQVGGTK